MNQQQTSPKSPATLPIFRHDGWTGEKMAIFCEALAETAVVAEACDQARMGISGAYAARRRNPAFAAAWDAALSIARDRLADTLLARSMEGNIEQIYKDGELVGERHVLDNRLGLQMLRRLDRLAERHQCSCAGRSPVQQGSLDARPRGGASVFEWSLAIEALRTGDDDGVARALALVEEPAMRRSKGDKVDEVEGASNLPLRKEGEGLDLSDRCWKDGIEDVWMTDFPPPEGFTGYENRPCDEYDDPDSYVRACTEEEVAILEADRASGLAVVRAEDEALRDEWFALLRQEAKVPPLPAREG